MPQIHAFLFTNTIKTLPTHDQISTTSMGKFYQEIYFGWQMMRNHTSSKVSAVALLVLEYPLDHKKQNAQPIHLTATQIITVVHIHLQWLMDNLWSFSQIKTPTASQPHECHLTYLPPVSMTVKFLEAAFSHRLNSILFQGPTLFLNLFSKIFIYTASLYLYVMVLFVFIKN